MFRLHSILCLVLCLGAILFSKTIYAAQDSETNDINVIDNVHAVLSARFSDLANDVDGLFGGIEEQDRANESWLRLRIDGVRFESEDIELRGNLKLKLVLPDTEKRLRLLLSTEDEDNLSPGENREGFDGADSDANNVSFALRFLQSVRDSNAIKFDVGARIRDDKAQAFGRLNLSRVLSSSAEKKRELRLVNNLWLFSASGYENRLKLGWRQGFAKHEKIVFQTRSELTWKNNERGASFVQLVGLYSEFGRGLQVGMESISNLQSSPGANEKRFRATEFRFRFRQNVWRDWFHYEVWPRVRWEAENDFSARFGLQVRVEVLFDSNRQ